MCLATKKQTTTTCAKVLGLVKISQGGHFTSIVCQELVHASTVVADYFACQKFRGLATKRDTQIFRGGKFSLTTSVKKNSARNNLLLTRAIVLMELCMRGYHVYSEATAGEELLCEREPRNTKDSNCYA